MRGAGQIEIELAGHLFVFRGRRLGENQNPAARSQLSKKEGTCAKKSIPKSGTVCSQVGRPTPPLPVITGNPEGLLCALVDLLLPALGVEAMTTKGDGDEHQDHV